MNPRLKIAIQVLIGIVGYGVWAFMAYDDPALRGDFLKLNMAMVAGTIGLALREMNTMPPADSPNTNQNNSPNNSPAAQPTDKVAP